MAKVTRNLEGITFYDHLNARLVTVIGRNRYASTVQWYLCACTDLDDSDEPDPVETYYQYCTQGELEAYEEMEASA